MNNQHTPGPWTVQPADGTLCAWRIQASKTVAFIAQTIGNNQEENANGQLIAQAPDLLAQRNALLEACKALHSVHRTFRDVPKDEQEWTGIDDIAMTQAEQAIALAQGGDK